MDVCQYRSRFFLHREAAMRGRGHAVGRAEQAQKMGRSLKAELAIDLTDRYATFKQMHNQEESTGP
jgi:hypothetical protein